MATQINVPLLKKEIEKQKNQCLYGPIYVWSDSSVSKSVSSVCNSYSGICKNPNLFKTFSFSASTNPAKIATDLASCLPRVLIVALANLDDHNVEKWIRAEFPTYLKKVPFSDIRFVNTRGLTKADRDYLESLSVFQNPTVLVFKMGHLIDSFVPPIDRPTISSNPSIAEQLRQRNEAIMSDLAKNPPPPPDSDDSLLSKHEKEKKQWEEKERLKKIEEAKKEQEAKRKERLRVKARIEEQRRMRQQHH